MATSANAMPLDRTRWRRKSKSSAMFALTRQVQLVRWPGRPLATSMRAEGKLASSSAESPGRTRARSHAMDAGRIAWGTGVELHWRRRASAAATCARPKHRKCIFEAETETTSSAMFDGKAIKARCPRPLSRRAAISANVCNNSAIVMIDDVVKVENTACRKKNTKREEPQSGSLERCERRSSDTMGDRL